MINDKALLANSPLARLTVLNNPYFLTSTTCNLLRKPNNCYRLTLLCLSSVYKA